jgi:antitoxin component of MazEF toxin-antitoxin module
MKLKVSEWGNSHGLRITSAVLEHLNIKAGDEIDVALTDKGMEVSKNTQNIDYLNSVKTDVINTILAQSKPVSLVEDPYLEAHIHYIVVAINPCSPIIREVPIGTPNAYATLADAKEAARQIIQSTIAEANASLSNLRQIGIDNISYITL